MEDIKKAMAEANITDAELSPDAKALIGDYKQMLQGVVMLRTNKKNGTPERIAVAEAKCERHKKLIVKEIFVLGEEKIENTPPPEPKKEPIVEVVKPEQQSAPEEPKPVVRVETIEPKKEPRKAENPRGSFFSFT